MAGDTANAILGPIAQKVITPVVDAIGRQFGYLFFYKRNIKNLESKVKRLEESRDDAESLFIARSRNNEERSQSSTGWLKDVEEVTKVAKEVVEAKDKSKGWCLNLKNRYVLSRKSTKLAMDIRELQDQVPIQVATNPALPAGMLTGSSSNYASKDFKTRTEIVNKVMEALKDDTINIIGICGLGGIGKTTILHEVRERATTQELFVEVAMTTVSQDPNMFKIQSDLAGMLGLTSIKDEENIIARADLLHKRLTNGSKILVVLDDVWSDLKLEEVGVPVGHAHARCKVVLASRNESVCANMGTQKTISVQVLSKEEAWHLFKKTAGDCVEREKLDKIAKDVADECGGLPIALLTLAGALSNKKREVWEDARTQLRQSRVTRIPEMNKKVYSSIMLSYNFLASELPEAQPLLLLCCQHSEDAEINVERLARYCLALELFKNVDKIGDARNRTYSVIDRLKSCFLLEAVDVDEEEKYETVKMHDVVRDVCLSIVSEVKEERDKVYMHIMAKDTDGGYDVSTSKVDYPKLKLLMEAPLDGSLDKSFLQQMEELRVFESLKGYEERPPPALDVLENLRVLSLEFNSLSEKIMSTIGSLSRLEILSFWGSSFWGSGLSSFPRQIGQLCNLKLLDLRCAKSGLIPSGILPGLNKLEVLCMGNFLLVGAAVENRYNYGRITELDSLSNLTTLQIDLKEPNNLLDLQRFRLENLESFFLGSYKDIGYKYRSSLRTLVGKTIKLGNFVGMKWVLEAKIQFIVRSAVDLQLKDIEDWTDPLILAEFVSLNKLVLENCKQLKYIISEGSLGKLRVLSLTNMPEMRRLLVGFNDPLCLVNLREVKICKCDAIESIFPHSIAKCLIQLQELRINNCLKLEEIFSEGELETDTTSRGEEIRKEPPNDFIVRFPKLRILILEGLPKLGGFYNLKLDSTIQQPFLNPLVMLPSLQLFNCSAMHQLKQIVGGGMLELSKVAESDWLQNLERIIVYNCASLEIVFDFDGLHVMEENDHALILGKLKDITLSYLPNLEHVSTRIPEGIHAFQNLGSLNVDNCGSLGYLISSSILHMLVNLERLSVRACKCMKEVIKMNEDYGVKKIVFRSLRTVELHNLEKLSSFCSGSQQAFEFPSPNSPNLRGFNNLELEDGRVQQPLFNPLVMLPSLKHLKCSAMHQLKQIVGGGMLELSKLATSDWLQNLEEITVKRCDSLETVFDFEGLHIIGGNHHILTLGKLKSIELDMLPNLAQLCRQIPEEIQAFQNLKELKVYHCDNLSYLISTSMAHMLVNLERITVKRCDSLETVFDFEGLHIIGGNHHILTLGELKSIELDMLPNLAQLCRQIPEEIQAFQNLKELKVYHCDNLSYLISTSMAHMLVNLESLVIFSCKSMNQVIKMDEDDGVKKIMFHSLRRVFLGVSKKLSSFCSSAVEFEFPSLNSPNLQCFNNLKLDDGVVQQPFFNPLVMLPSLKELECDGMDLKQVMFPMLAASDWLQNLEKLTVSDCYSIETVFDFEGLPIMGENAHVPTLSQLKSIELRYLPNLEHLCRLIPQGFHAFQNLKNLSVYNCDNLGYLISSSMAHMLVNLESLRVGSCKSMKEVIKMNEDCGVKKIVFRSLSSLRLHDFEKLSSFCSSEQQSIEFPSLGNVLILNCSEMETFCCGHLTVEKLDGVKTSYSDNKLFWKGDLNETVRHLNARNRVNQTNSDLKDDVTKCTNEVNQMNSQSETGSIKEDDVTECTNEDDSGNSSSTPLEQGTPTEALMPPTNVSPPNASLTPDVVSPSPQVSDNNEELANSSSPELRKVALPTLIEFAPSASMDQSVHSSDSPVQPKADKELSDMPLSSRDDDWKRKRILIQGVYVKAEMKTIFEEILTAKPNFLSGLWLKMARGKTEYMESAIRSLQILRLRTAHTILPEELAYIKDSLDDLKTIGLDTAWLERGYQRAMLVMKEQKVVSAAAELAMLEREKMEDEAKLEASTARLDAFKAEYGALMLDLEVGKELFGGGFDLETSLGDGLLD